ncbi:2-oxo-hept-4-ene-1,7-dioate hydratase [BD1-7 clade bacterium]|uniref:2-oxo-hept-4-ene-1,7-dioate hydratase n=1 Tax=BD1-7 clade bacterium TaxID=2029982 RepID=A0A5S9PK62_9GAMM|nr:2-oxo-hept-4-ene-1,7-dioate hydratase [BD1-7 clade bacterium]
MNPFTRLTAASAAVVLSSLFVLVACKSQNDDVTVATYINGWVYSRAVPLPTEEGLVSTMDEAYAFGAQFVNGLPGADQRYGFKFGCGADVCPFAEHIPLVGSLWASMVSASGSSINVDEYVRGFVEGELAFRFAVDVATPITAAQARQLATEVAPSAELPDFPFGDRPLNEARILDVVAANGIARGLVIGEFVSTSTLDVDTIVMTGTRDGELVLSGSAADVTGGSHWEALALAVSLLLENGHVVKAGDVIVTGTLGVPTPLQVAEYDLDFGDLGRVVFRGVR